MRRKKPPSTTRWRDQTGRARFFLGNKRWNDQSNPATIPRRQAMCGIAGYRCGVVRGNSEIARGGVSRRPGRGSEMTPDERKDILRLALVERLSIAAIA